MGKKITNVNNYKSYVNYHLCPKELNTDENGEYVKTQLERLVKQYNTLQTSLEAKKEKRQHLLAVIEHKETSPRSKYNRLLAKTDKTVEEHEALYIAISDIEDGYNALPAIERGIRETERMLTACFPKGYIEFVQEQLNRLNEGVM